MFQLAPLLLRAGAQATVRGTASVANATKRAVGAASRGISAAARASSAVGNMNASGQLQNWAGTLGHYFPSMTQGTTVTVVGKRGTPSKDVLHVALATAFGSMAQKKMFFGDVILNVQHDVMANVIQVDYVQSVGLRSELFGFLLRSLGGLTPSGIIERLSADIQSGYPGILDAAGDMTANMVPQVLPGATGKALQLGQQFLVRSLIRGMGFVLGFKGGVAQRAPQPIPPGGDLRLPNGAQAQPGVPPNPGANVAVAPVGFLKDLRRMYLDFDASMNVGLAESLWPDPKDQNAADATGFIAKETIRAALPAPTLSNSLKTLYPRPFFSMVEKQEVMVTRFDACDDANGVSVTQLRNPEPPTPARLESRGAAWTYANPPKDVMPGTTPAYGYGFDLRMLVAQALSDPGLELNPPATDIFIRPN